MIDHKQYFSGARNKKAPNQKNCNQLDALVGSWARKKKEKHTADRFEQQKQVFFRLYEHTDFTKTQGCLL